MATQATAATAGERSPEAPRAVEKTKKGSSAKVKKPFPLSLEERLELKRKAVRKHRSVIRFFSEHEWLLRSAEHREIARRVLRQARRGLARATRAIAYYRRAIRARERRRLAAAPPRVAICNVFGRYCAQAIDVAWCESRLSTSARNGQYLGLFQMGANERRMFGHGHSAYRQAVAAHRYFVLSGRDWSPWGCRWAAY